MHSMASVEEQPESAASPVPKAAPPRAAAFFDVDGTLVHTTIVHYYIYFRRRRLPPVVRSLWHAGFLVRCLHYLVLDRISRTKVNEVFYRNYRGLVANGLRARARDCFEAVIRPNLFPEGEEKVREHREAGRDVALVTGSIDFIIAPLAEHLEVDHVEAPRLVEVGGRFTGALEGPAVGADEKRRRVVALAEQAGIDLAQSYAYGDSIADAPMLEAVGHPVAVNPDSALERLATERGWPIERWTRRT